ncbi:hypothetical protein [Streptomyces sp. BE147]|uniref:hypothetical protein n=1 Tax=unclassified Streptomyces TaxID=2593676 RepID=UPI002E765E35|nr:hypothetical protein [Streptomyces sp. BE147]MEE1739750.1 hypothetical protein [Streptomyces sp. BE147]
MSESLFAAVSLAHVGDALEQAALVRSSCTGRCWSAAPTTPRSTSSAGLRRGPVPVFRADARAEAR